MTQPFTSEQKLVESQYREIFQHHKKHVERHFVFLWQSTQEPSQLGLAVSKKNVPLATKRNLCKRLIRESFRVHQNAVGIKLIVIARASAAKANNQEIRACLDNFWQKQIKA